jgi:arginine decarboxylase
MAVDTRIDEFFIMHSARADRWRSVLSAAERWVRGESVRADVEKLLSGLEVIEEFHAYPGIHAMHALQASVANNDARAVASMARRISDAILTNSIGRTTDEDFTIDDDRLPNIVPGANADSKTHRPYFEVLFVSNQPPARWPAVVAEIKRLRRPEDDFVYEPVLV